MIKVIAFDYAGVVIPGPMTQWVRNNLHETDQMWKKYVENSNRWDKGELSLERVYEILSEITGIPKEQIWEKFYSKAELNEDVVEIIKKLKRNYKVFLFSNFVSELLRKLLESHKITDIFDEIIISSEYKMRKPDPRFYELLLKTAGVKAEEILFIDDRQENIEAAKVFGINTVLFKDVKTLKDNLKLMQLSF
ncbi:MAG: HAD family phosphatase [Candidatus Levybacteria bacterium]|nr:HAD family phosphatase [Candidatus Levybacteria bacterium]